MTDYLPHNLAVFRGTCSRHRNIMWLVGTLLFPQTKPTHFIPQHHSIHPTNPLNFFFAAARLFYYIYHYHVPTSSAVPQLNHRPKTCNFEIGIHQQLISIPPKTIVYFFPQEVRHITERSNHSLTHSLTPPSPKRKKLPRL